MSASHAYSARARVGFVSGVEQVRKELLPRTALANARLRAQRMHVKGWLDAMQQQARTHAALILVAIAACAQAPSFDEEAFGGTEFVVVDASTPDAGSVVIDASLGGALGTEPHTLAWQDASGSGAIGAKLQEAGAPLVSDAATASDAATGIHVPATTSDAATSAMSAAGGDGGAVADAATRAADASSAAPARDAAIASCSALTCRNNCLALPRCCNEDNECACLNPATRECSLPSL